MVLDFIGCSFLNCRAVSHRLSIPWRSEHPAKAAIGSRNSIGCDIAYAEEEHQFIPRGSAGDNRNMDRPDSGDRLTGNPSLHRLARTNSSWNKTYASASMPV
jgi:hypothetical protein